MAMSFLKILNFVSKTLRKPKELKFLAISKDECEHFVIPVSYIVCKGWNMYGRTENMIVKVGLCMA